MDQEIRAFSLVTEPVLDDRAVRELADSVAIATTLGAEALSALTRRESTLEFGDLLEPIETDVATTRPGIRFTVVDADQPSDLLAILLLSSEVAVGLADLFFGGPGDGDARRLTEIEAHAIQSSFAGVVAPVVAVVSGIEGAKVTLTMEKDPPLPAENLVQLSMSVTVGSTSLEAALFVPNPDASPKHSTNHSAMVATVREMPIDVDVDLARVQMPAAEVQALAEGDVLIFDASPGDDVVLRSGPRELLRGQIGENLGRRYVEVTEVVG